MIYTVKQSIYPPSEQTIKHNQPPPLPQIKTHKKNKRQNKTKQKKRGEQFKLRTVLVNYLH